jgi:hypothetical protein
VLTLARSLAQNGDYRHCGVAPGSRYCSIHLLSDLVLAAAADIRGGIQIFKTAELRKAADGNGWISRSVPRW